MGTSSPMSSSFLLLLLLLFLSFSPCCCSSSSGNLLASDAIALLDFKLHLDRGGGSSLGSWNSSSLSAVCISWEGVFCKNQARVSVVRLPGKSLYGTIAPATLGKLDALETLSLRSNKLSGSLPLDLAHLPALRKLYLQKNNFSGDLPSNFSVWPLLQQLDLSFNTFSGQVPATLGTLTHLRALYLQSNALAGSIPSSIGASPALQILNLSDNRLSGSVPPSLAAFPASSFAGNADLCGAPLPPCSSSTAATSAPPSLSPPYSPSSPGGKKTPSKWAIAGIASGSTALFVALLLLCVYVVQRRRRKEEEKKGGNKGLQPGEQMAMEEDHQNHHHHRLQQQQQHRPSRFQDGGGNANNNTANNRREVSQDGSNVISAAAGGKDGEEKSKLIFIDSKKMFDLEDLLRASAEVLGKGSLGTAYKAVLEDGLIVAVKRLRDVVDDNNNNISRRDDNFLHIQMIGSLRHENLLPLRAFYFDKEENLLVYDYMQNGSLSALLHGNKGSVSPLDWESRVRIAVSAGRGLRYLHSRKVVHGMVKSSNVLLKSNLEAILSDYALVQMVSAQRFSMPPSGYAAPEVVDPRRATEKADVYSFGVVLLELLTGKMPLGGGGGGGMPAVAVPPISSVPSASYGGGGVAAAAATQDPMMMGSGEGGNGLGGVVDLPRWVQSVVREEWTAEVFDPDLLLLAERTTSMSASSVASQQEDMLHVLQIAMPCVAPSPDQRPTMAQVVAMMENLRRSPATDDDKSSGS